MPDFEAQTPEPWMTGLLDAAPKRRRINREAMTVDKTPVEAWFGIAPPPTMELKHRQAFMTAHQLQEDPNTADPGCLFGIEVEVENVLAVNPNLQLGFWTMTTDNSLRNNGREFISRPIPLSCVRPALEHLKLCLNESIDFSSRTSVHFHMDARNMTLNQVLSLLYTYSVVENLLFTFASTSRRTNIFCVPINTTELLKYEVVKQAQDFFLNISGNWHKYAALNLLPVAGQGTVEFRHMPGTLDISKLVIWANLLAQLRRFAYRVNLEEHIRLISDLNTSSQYLAYVHNVFGPYAHYLDTSNLASAMETGATNVKLSSAANVYHQQIVGTTPVWEQTRWGALLPQIRTFASLSPTELLLCEQLRSEFALHISREFKGYDIVKFFGWIVNNVDRSQTWSAQLGLEDLFKTLMFVNKTKKGK